MKRVAILIAILTAGGGAAHAADTDVAQNNLAHDYANCAAFYHVASHLRALDGKLRREYQQAEAAALQHSSALTSQPVAMSRYKIALQTVRSRGNEDEMLTTAFADYGYICDELMQQPTKRMQYWREKLADRRGG